MNSVSAHQLPLAKALARFSGDDNVTYVDAGFDRQIFQEAKIDSDVLSGSIKNLDECLYIITGIRDCKKMQFWLGRDKIVFYSSERWFKPPIGMLRLVHPRYLLMAWRFVRLLRQSDKLWYLPIGIHAARDMARLCGLMHGDLRCLFRAPKLEFERKPGGKIKEVRSGGVGSDGVENKQVMELGKKYCLDKMRMWGYFVESSKLRVRELGVVDNGRIERGVDMGVGDEANSNLASLRILWVGRLLNWKRVDTIIKAVGELATYSTRPNITLDIYGTGPEETKLKKLAAKYGEAIKFYPPVPITEVRKLMREHDIYVLASNGYEGWGAVVSEALEEGMRVIGTYEAGSSATILPENCLYHAGDWRKLAELLASDIPNVGIGEWTARHAATVIME